MRINHKPLLIATALLTLIPNFVWSSPFDEDQEICPQWECDQAGNCRKLDLTCGSSPDSSGAQGYQLYFDGELVSGPDAQGYTSQQAKENCTWNMQTKPQMHIRCLYNGQVFGDRPPSNSPGYELYFDGELVSGADAQGYTFQQAEENCIWNMQTKPQIHIRCLYNGQVFRER
jgi:hypothetical protein